MKYEFSSRHIERLNAFPAIYSGRMTEYDNQLLWQIIVSKINELVDAVNELRAAQKGET